MSRFARTIHIDAPVDEVWAALMDVERWPDWASQFKQLAQIDERPLGLASRVRVRPKGLPASVWTVTDFVEPRTFTWTSRLLPGLSLVGGHVVLPEGDGSSAEFSLEARGPVGGALGPLLSRAVFSRNTRNATEGLKRHVET